MHHRLTRPDVTAWRSGVVMPSEWMDLDSKTFRSLNGDEGGVWNPSSPIEIGGSGVQLTSAPLTFLGATGGGTWNPGTRIDLGGSAGLRVTGPFVAENAIFRDLALTKNWLKSTLANHGRVLLWSSTYSRWYSFGVSGGNPLGARTLGGFDWTTGLTMQNGAGLTPRAAAGNSAGILVVGGTPGSASTAKIRQSLDGITWAARDSVNNGTEGVRALHWYGPASLFIAALDNSVTTNIETSPDGRTWNKRTAPNAHARGAIASNSAIAVMLARSSVTTDKCITSTDGITWTERTLPASQTWGSVVWDSYYGRFVAAGDTYCASSTDGITWTIGANSFGLATLVGDGRLLVGTNDLIFEVYAGYFDGTALQMASVMTSTQADLQAQSFAVGDHQFMLCDVDGNHYQSLRGGP
jgi:hypothetical protein